MERLRCAVTNTGDLMRTSQDLETHLKRTMDFMGNRNRISVMIASGKEETVVVLSVVMASRLLDLFLLIYLGFARNVRENV